MRSQFLLVFFFVIGVKFIAINYLFVLYFLLVKNFTRKWSTRDRETGIAFYAIHRVFVSNSDVCRFTRIFSTLKFFVIVILSW